MKRSLSVLAITSALAASFGGICSVFNRRVKAARAVVEDKKSQAERIEQAEAKRARKAAKRAANRMFQNGR